MAGSVPKKTETKPAAAPQPPAPLADDKPDDRPGSEQTMVVLPARDEPVRRGGYILTDDGWVPEEG